MVLSPCNATSSLKVKPGGEPVAYFGVMGFLSLRWAPMMALRVAFGKKILHGIAVSAVLDRFDSFITSDNDLEKSYCSLPLNHTAADVGAYFCHWAKITKAKVVD